MTREQYKYLKRCNKPEMEKFLKDMTDGLVNEAYQKGIQAGADEMARVLSAEFINKIETALKNTPGIGAKRFDTIMASITSEFSKADTKDGSEQS